jgi:hypothetical protein
MKRLTFLLILLTTSSCLNIGQDNVREELLDPLGFGLKVKIYAKGRDEIKFKVCTHIYFGPNNQEIVTDLRNNRFLYRASSEESFQISPIPLKGQHSVLYNSADKLYYANDTDNHRIISFSDLSKKKISAETEKVDGIRLKRPHDIVIDPATGWIYAINPNSGHVFRFTAIGENESAIAVPVKGYSRALTFVNGKLYVIGSAKGRIVEIVDWESKKFNIYDSFDPTKRSGPAGSWTTTGLVINDIDFFNGHWYATSFFTKKYARGSNSNEHKLIRFKKLEDLVTGNWTDISALVPKGMTPYYLTTTKEKLYLAIFNAESRGKGDCILQLTPLRASP